ncbi:MAG: hypothetical protein NTX22_16735 [Ignavibacteriales bacterium]|nr:hypothetical protein [Ignavibacteriales bacterium]
MLKKIFTLFLVILTISTLSLAQQKGIERTGGYARLLSMGSNPYLIDPYQMTSNPAWTTVYSDFVWGDLGSSTGTNFGKGGVGQFAGFNFKLNDRLVLGALLTRGDFNGLASIGSLSACSSLVGQTNSVVGAGTVVPINNNLEVLGSFNFGGGNSLGFGVSYASSTNESKPAAGGGGVASASQIGFNFGFLMNRQNFKIDVGASLLLPSTSVKPDKGTETKFSQTIIAVTGRVFLGLSEKVSLVPIVAVNLTSGSMDIPVADPITGTISSKSTDLQSTSQILGGVGINYKTDDLLLAGGIAMVMQSVTTPEVNNVSPELSNSIFLFPVWNLGAEFKIASWLTGRLGYLAVSGKTTSQSAADSKKFNETITSLSGISGATLGLGFKFDAFSLDATVNEDVIRQGLNNIGGGGATFGYISVSYAF